MKKTTLFLLRKSPDRIDPSLFLVSESQGDVVLLDGGMPLFAYTGGNVFSLLSKDRQTSLSYDVLVKKIFECDHTVVI